MQTFTVLRHWILLTLVVSWFSLWHNHEICQQLLNKTQTLVQTFLQYSGENGTLGDEWDSRFLYTCFSQTFWSCQGCSYPVSQRQASRLWSLRLFLTEAVSMLTVSCHAEERVIFLKSSRRLTRHPISMVRLYARTSVCAHEHCTFGEPLIFHLVSSSPQNHICPTL